MTNVKLIDLV